MLQGATQVFFQFLVQEGRNNLPDDFILQTYTVLSKLALKGWPSLGSFYELSLLRAALLMYCVLLVDKKFGVKARLSQALPVIISYIKSHTTSSSLRNSQPVLSVLKQCSNNGMSIKFQNVLRDTISYSCVTYRTTCILRLFYRTFFSAIKKLLGQFPQQSVM